MKKKEEMITVIGVKQANNGYVFLHEKPLSECEDCRLYNVCMINLEANRVYEIIEVRDKIFPCHIHYGGVRVVKVVEADRKYALDPKFVFPEAILTFKSQECQNVGCDNFTTCVPKGLENGDKVKIIEVMEEITCPEGHSFIEVILRRLSLPQLQHP